MENRESVLTFRKDKAEALLMLKIKTYDKDPSLPLSSVSNMAPKYQPVNKADSLPDARTHGVPTKPGEETSLVAEGQKINYRSMSMAHILQPLQP